MRRKLFCILLASLLLALLASATLAENAVRRSAQGEAVFQARKALEADYGLTPETIGLFHMEVEQDGDTWNIGFFPIGFVPRPLGEYHVILVPEKAPETSWSYDSFDPETWRNGGLESPVWGQPQLHKVLEDREAAMNAIALIDPAWLQEEPYMPQMPEGMDALAEDESIWFGQILQVATPSQDDISQEEATAIAARAIMEESSLSSNEIDAAEILVSFKSRDGDSPLWMFSFQFYLSGGGVYQDWGVVVDASTGVILHSNIVSGSEG